MVLIILAAVSIAMLTGQNGILTKAQEAKTKNDQATIDEQKKLTQAEAAMNFEEHTDQATGVKIPAYCAVSQVSGENTLEDGLVIIDKNGNEWTWIEVPKTTEVYPTAGLNITEFSYEDYAKIKADLIMYATDYREGKQGQGLNWSDEWYDINGETDTAMDGGMGLTKAQYDAKYQAMLSSVYINHGFFIGKYEVGIKEDIVRGAGTSLGTAIEYSTNGQTPVIMQNKIPYSWVRCSQAEELSEKLAIGEKTSSLMFGIQWDLVMKYLEVNGGIELGNTVDERKTALKLNSESFGNYSNVSFDISQGKYSTDYGASWNEISGIYTKTASKVLLTTGATNRNAILNVYDIAGNVWEWTLEKTSYLGDPCAFNGGSCDNYDPASTGRTYVTSVSCYDIGFRATLY